MFSYVSIEERIPTNHPLRRIRRLADQALDRLNPTFCRLYALEGRLSVPPEQLLLASLLQAFYGIRSERLLLEQLHYNLLFRWFVGLSPDDANFLSISAVTDACAGATSAKTAANATKSFHGVIKGFVP
jgi:transposase